MTTVIIRTTLRRILLTSLLACWFAAQNGDAHQPFKSYVQHDAAIEVSSANIDCALRLTFHGEAALAFRKAMDQDEDRLIDAEEKAQAVHSQQDQWMNECGAAINNKALDWILLYDPAVDLLNDERVSPSPLEVTLHWFVRNAPSPDGHRLKLHDRIVLDQPAIFNAQISYNAQDGARRVETFPAVISADDSSAPRIVEFFIPGERQTARNSFWDSVAYRYIAVSMLALVMVWWMARKYAKTKKWVDGDRL